MILRFILHIEKHRGYRWRISFKRAPFVGQRVFDRGWGWRRLIGCDKCSGVGYLDTSEAEYQYRTALMDALAESPPAWIETNAEANLVDPYARGEDGALGAVIDELNERFPRTSRLRTPDTPGLYRLVADEQGRRFVRQGDAQPREDAILGRRSVPTSDPAVTEEELVFASDWEEAYDDVLRQNRRSEEVDKEF